TELPPAPPAESVAPEPEATTTTIDPNGLEHLDDVEAPEWVPATRTEELAAAMADGDPTVQQAIDAFSILYLPMPGDTPTSLPLGEGLGSHTTLRLIEAARSQLAPEQLAVLDSLDAAVEDWASLDTAGASSTGASPADGSTTTTIDPATSTTSAPAGFRAARQPALGPVTDKYLALLQQAYLDWHAFKPDLPQTPVELIISPTQVDIADMDSQYPVKSIDPSRTELVCRIRVFPKMVNAGWDDDVILTAFAHELFHCAQDVWNPGGGFPDWLTEGSAHFAAFDLYSSKFPPPDHYTLPASWFTKANAPLSTRSYPAWPLFESFRQYGGDAYAAVKKAYEGGPDAASGAGDGAAGWLSVAGMDELWFRATWSANDLRSTAFPEKEWMMNWPALSQAGPRDNITSIGVRGVGTYSVKGSKSFGQQQLVVTMAPKVGLVLALADEGPLLTHSANGTVVVPEGQTRKFCFDESGCRCPSGFTSGALPMDGRDMVFSFAAQRLRGGSEVIAVPWDSKKLCGEPEKKIGRHNGDPHLTSFDGQAFDVMAGGEFVAARDDRGGFEVQVRNEVMDGGGTGTSAVALGDGTHRIVFAGDLDAPGATTVAVDGKAEDATATVEAGDVTVQPEDDRNWTATWPDGSYVRLHWNHGWFATVALDAARASHVTGLLGTANDDPRDDLALADGRRIDPGDGAGLDGEYAPQWYVEQKDSLFDYRPGETTKTFRAVPPPPPTIDPETVGTCTTSLPAAATKAEVAACAYDIAATGDDSYVTAYSQVVTSRVVDDPVAAELIQFAAAPDEPAGGPAASGSSITLSGTLASGTFGRDGVVEELSGTIEVAEGSIILGQVQLCAPGRDVVMRATLRGTDNYNDVHLCDPIGFNVAFHDTDEVVAGEAALWASAGGTYDVRITTDSDEALVTNVTVSTDPDPTVVDAATTMRDGYRGTLSGRADTVVLLMNTGDGSAAWNVTGTDEACGDAQYGADPVGDGALLALGVCGHTQVVNLGPSGDLTVPFIVYTHTDDRVDVTFLPQPDG
ncbi:MAG: VWD domain-containing protein, partial [Ilumatobacteraceae bacterium]